MSLSKEKQSKIALIMSELLGETDFVNLSEIRKTEVIEEIQKAGFRLNSANELRNFLNRDTYAKFWENFFSITNAQEQEIQEQGELLAKTEMQRQKQQDKTRITRKQLREGNRVKNATSEFVRSMCQVAHDYRGNLPKAIYKPEAGNFVSNNVGIIQLSDHHGGEEVNIPGVNEFNWNVYGQRFREYIIKSIRYFKASGIKNIVVLVTGDMVNSDRRLDEILENSLNRSSVVYCMHDIFVQALTELAANFENVDLFSICGNESRVNLDLNFSRKQASENYDFVLHHMLQETFNRCVGDWENRTYERSEDGIMIRDLVDPNEMVVRLWEGTENEFNILMIHGHQRGLGVTNAKLEQSASKLVAKYSKMGITIHYMVCGHIHFCNISDGFARSSSIVGSNTYSNDNLGLHGRASQNIYIAKYNGGVDAAKIDLQECELVTWESRYKIDTKFSAVNPSKTSTATYEVQGVHSDGSVGVINSVVI